MKKLNRKGFTLIELLAVVVILAIVLVVTIPTVLNSMNSAKQSQLNNAANTVAEWLQKQRELDELGSAVGGAASTAYTGIKSSLNTATSTNRYTLTDALLKAAGFTGGTADATGTAYYNSTSYSYCVTLTPANGTDAKFKGLAASSSNGC